MTVQPTPTPKTMADYRATYEIDRANRCITVLRVEHRSDAHR